MIPCPSRAAPPRQISFLNCATDAPAFDQTIAALRVLVPALQDAGPHVVVTTREQEVFDLVVKGKSNKEIAKGLVISERTAKFHVSNLLAKYDVEGRGELVVAFLKAAE